MGSCITFIKRLICCKKRYESDEETDSLVPDIEPNYLEKEYEEIRQSSDSVVL